MRPQEMVGFSAKTLEIFHAHFSIPKDFKKEAGADNFSDMNGDHSGTSIRMSEEVMASLDAEDCKSCLRRSTAIISRPFRRGVLG